MSSKTKPEVTPDLDITGSNITIYPGVERTTNSHDANDSDLVQNMSRFRTSPWDFLREVRLHVSGEGWRSYDKIIGQPVFYSGFSESLTTAIMSSPMLLDKIADLAKQRVQVEENDGLFPQHDVFREKKKARRRIAIETSLKEVSEKMADDMICKLESKAAIRSAYFVITSLLTRAYNQGIHVSAEEVLRLRSVAEEAAKKNQSIIFLPNHRSHIDYMSLQLTCYRLGLSLPTVVAGDNLNFPLVGYFLQHVGAMWIRRSFGDDQLYVTLLQTYIDVLLQKGLNLECFIEGGRSRIGKLLPPKFGILSFMLESVLSGRVEDAVICPVSTQYDKVIEVDSYISELLGQPKPKENLLDFLSASSILSLKLGRVDVRFHKPWSLRRFIDEQNHRLESLTQAQQADLNKAYHSNLRIRLLRTLGYKVLSDINDIAVIMPTALIGTVLLTLRGRGVGKTELIRRVEWLVERVRAQGGRVAHFGGPTTTIVERGLDVLGPNLVGVDRTLAEPTYHAVDRFQLSFYRNMTIHLFISQALVSASIYTRVKAGGAWETQAISYPDLLDQVSVLSQLFRGEFIFRTDGLTVNLQQTVLGLEADGVIKINRSSGQSSTSTEHSAFESVELSRAERESGRENFDFYCFLIWPFIEVAWLAAVSLLMLTPPVGSAEANNSELVWLDFKAVQAHAQLLGKTLYAQGDLAYFEAVNMETLKNAQSRYEEEEIIIVKKPPRGNRTGVAQMVRLSDDWMPKRDASGRLQAEGKLWDFCEEISRCRVEGKNRRDGDAVSGRILRLIDTVSSRIWASKVASVGSETGSSPEGTVASAERKAAKKDQRRRAPLRTRANM